MFVKCIEILWSMVLKQCLYCVVTFEFQCDQKCQNITRETCSYEILHPLLQPKGNNLSMQWNHQTKVQSAWVQLFSSLRLASVIWKWNLSERVPGSLLSLSWLEDSENWQNIRQYIPRFPTVGICLHLLNIYCSQVYSEFHFIKVLDAFSLLCVAEIYSICTGRELEHFAV